MWGNPGKHLDVVRNTPGAAPGPAPPHISCRICLFLTQRDPRRVIYPDKDASGFPPPTHTPEIAEFELIRRTLLGVVIAEPQCPRTKSARPTQRQLDRPAKVCEGMMCEMNCRTVGLDVHLSRVELRSLTWRFPITQPEDSAPELLVEGGIMWHGLLG